MPGKGVGLPGQFDPREMERYDSVTYEKKLAEAVKQERERTGQKV